MHFQESETIELKKIPVEEIKKEVIAFANSSGGILYIGIADDGKIIGLDNPDQVTQQVSNWVRDSIKPDLTMFTRYKTETLDGKQIVTVEVQRGTERPYYLANKGIRPEGVYVRQGTSSVPATATAIRKMIKETDGESFETMRSLEQELTFLAAKKEFADREIKFSIPQKKTLGLLNSDDIFTNLGWLLSDQCTQTVKIASFVGIDQSIFRDRKEFGGSLLEQMNQVYDYISRHNQIQASFQKLRRIDTWDYPEVAIREALLNLLVHRDYSFSTSSFIRLYSNRIEFTSIGGLPPGVSLDDIMLGLSVCRNPRLANIFHRLSLIEAYGTGINKIMQAYSGTGKQPKIEVSDNAFRITLPNINEDSGQNSTEGSPLKPEHLVAEYIKNRGLATRQETQEITGLERTSAGRLLAKMVDENLIRRIGKGKNTHYVLP